jgi:hypothetical protein
VPVLARGPAAARTITTRISRINGAPGPLLRPSLYYNVSRTMNFPLRGLRSGLDPKHICQPNEGFDDG